MALVVNGLRTAPVLLLCACTLVLEPDMQDAQVPDAQVSDAQALDVLDAAFVMQTLQIESVTPNSVCVNWDAVALAESLGEISHYQIRFSDDEGLLLGGGGDVWDATDDPNLAFYSSPGGANTVFRSTLTELLPETTYHILLTAYDAADVAVQAALGQATTHSTPSGSLTLFADTLGAGFFYCEHSGMGDVLTDPVARAHSGSAALGCVGNGEWIHLKLRYLALDVSVLSSSVWDSAYLEFYMRVDCGSASPPVPFAELYLGPLDGSSFDYRYPRYFSLKGGATWHRVQIALSILNRSDQLMTPELFGSELDRFIVGLTGGDTCELLIDDIVLKFAPL